MQSQDYPLDTSLSLPKKRIWGYLGLWANIYGTRVEMITNSSIVLILVIILAMISWVLAYAKAYHLYSKYIKQFFICQLDSIKL